MSSTRNTSALSHILNSRNDFGYIYCLVRVRMRMRMRVRVRMRMRVRVRVRAHVLVLLQSVICMYMFFMRSRYPSNMSSSFKLTFKSDAFRFIG